MRDELAVALTKRIGEVITVELARAVMRDVFSDVPAVRADLMTDGAPTRERIDALEDELRKCPQVEIKVRHYFSEGLYAREITIPKGTMLTGKIHRTVHLDIVSKGRIAVVTENGRKIIEAPCAMVSPPGTKRVGYALEDTVWTTLHGTPETDLEVLEQQLIAPSFEALAQRDTLSIEGE